MIFIYQKKNLTIYAIDAMLEKLFIKFRNCEDFI